MDDGHQNNEFVRPPRDSTADAAAAPGEVGPGGASSDAPMPSIAARMEYPPLKPHRGAHDAHGEAATRHARTVQSREAV